VVLVGCQTVCPVSSDVDRTSRCSFSTSSMRARGASSSIMRDSVRARQGSNQLVQFALGGRLLSSLGVLDREDHHERDG